MTLSLLLLPAPLFAEHILLGSLQKGVTAPAGVEEVAWNGFVADVHKLSSEKGLVTFQKAMALPSLQKVMPEPARQKLLGFPASSVNVVQYVFLVRLVIDDAGALDRVLLLKSMQDAFKKEVGCKAVTDPECCNKANTCKWLGDACADFP